MQYRIVLKYILFFILSSIIALFDTSFFSTFNGMISQMNLAIFTAIFLIIIFDGSTSILFYILTMTLTSIFSQSMLFIPFIIGISVLFILDLLLQNVFTNRSYYVLVALGSASWVVYHLLWGIVLMIAQIFSSSHSWPSISLSWWINTLLLTILVFGVYSLGYVLIAAFSKRFKSYFITTYGKR